jgi:hypothetical protein
MTELRRLPSCGGEAARFIRIALPVDERVLDKGGQSW